MTRDFPERLQEYNARAEMRKARIEAWQRDVRTAQKTGAPPPEAPDVPEEPEPMAPRLMLNDVTIEKVAMHVASASPKGILMVRDELAGWFLGMNAYNAGARSFWIEGYGGRPYCLDRVKHPQPIVIPHLTVAWHGGIQPSRLAQVMLEADDGLLARFCWFWPSPVPFELAEAAPNIDFAIAAFDRLRMLEMAPPKDGLPAKPWLVGLTDRGRVLIEEFGRNMQERQETAGGLLVSAIGKARGLALRLALVIEYLWWAGEDGTTAGPKAISEKAFLAAAGLVSEYLIPMAERVYGDAVASSLTRNTETLARWIKKTRASEVHVRQLQRRERLPGLGEAAPIHEACEALIEAGWLIAPPPGGKDGRARAAYRVRPEVWEAVL